MAGALILNLRDSNDLLVIVSGFRNFQRSFNTLMIRNLTHLMIAGMLLILASADVTAGVPSESDTNHIIQKSEKTPYELAGHRIMYADSAHTLNIQCYGSGDFRPWYKLSGVTTSAEALEIHFSHSTDTLFVGLKSSETAKTGTANSLAWEIEQLDGLCAIGVPFMLGSENESAIIRRPKLELKQLSNPLVNSVLTFSFVNPEVISDIMRFEILDMSGHSLRQIELSKLNNEQREQEIHIEPLVPGKYLLLLANAEQQVSYPIFVQ